MKNTKTLLSWDEKLDFYSKYHKHPTNILLHVIAMPNIIWTLCVFLSYIPCPIFNNMSYVVYSKYVYYYYTSDKKIGKNMSVFLGVLLLWSKLFMLFPNHLFYSFLIHLLSWGLQFAGHKYWEKNSPALKDSIVEAFTIAPVFCLKHLEPFIIPINEKYKIEAKIILFYDSLKSYLLKKTNQVVVSEDEDSESDNELDNKHEKSTQVEDNLNEEGDKKND